jgi:uncharacterized protein (DUF4415 family)
MNAKRNAMPNSYPADSANVDEHEIELSEYDELPELTDDMLARATLKIGDQTIYSYAHELITVPLPVEVFQRWQATGPGWRVRMTELLSKI